MVLCPMPSVPLAVRMPLDAPAVEPLTSFSEFHLVESVGISLALWTAGIKLVLFTLRSLRNNPLSSTHAPTAQSVLIVCKVRTTENELFLVQVYSVILKSVSTGTTGCLYKVMSFNMTFPYMKVLSLDHVLMVLNTPPGNNFALLPGSLHVSPCHRGFCGFCAIFLSICSDMMSLGLDPGGTTEP